MIRVDRPLLVLAIVFACCVVQSSAAASDERAENAAPQPVFSLPGEFEHQDAILLAWDETDLAAQKTQLEIIGAIWKTVPVIVLVSSADAQSSASTAVRQAGLPGHAVRFVRVAVDTVWARDYGPAAVSSTVGASALINSEYERSERPNDDDVPLAVGPLLGMQTIDAPLRIEGGNLLSNGAGLCIVTSKVMDDNADRGYDEAQVTRLIKAAYGAREVLILEPLLGEPTGHVDMFATFTAVDRVIVGECPAENDPVNAEILNRNAQRLSQVMTPRGPMHVERIPMPPSEFDVWRTYTNVLYANGTLLVPVYSGTDHAGRRQALSVYRQALPGWKIVGIDSDDVIQAGGAIHCLSMNLGRIAQLPETTPLDGRPDPVRQIPYAAEGAVIVDSGWLDGPDRLVFGHALTPHRNGGAGWKPARRQIAGRRLVDDLWELDAPVPDDVDLPDSDTGWSRPDAFHGNVRQETQWKRYQQKPDRLRDYDHRQRISILRD